MKIVTLFAVSIAVAKAITVEDFCVDTKIVAPGGISTAELQQGTSGGSSVKALQEWRGGNKLKDVLVDGASVADYGVSIVQYAAWGIAMGILSCCCCFWTSLCRMCGKCHKPRRVYEPKDKIKVTILYLIFALGCFITSTLGVVAIGNFVNSSAQIVCGLEDFRVETLGFFDSILKPVKKLSSVTSTNIDKISVNLGNAGKVTIAWAIDGIKILEHFLIFLKK